MSDDIKPTGKDSPKTGNWALILLIVGEVGGWGAITAFAVGTSSPLTVFSVISMVAAASMLAGVFLGFIFAVPRTHQEKDVEGQKPPTGQVTVKDTENAYRPNTNLEQISDWLTKILVGASLTQIGNILRWLNHLGTVLKPGFGDTLHAPIFAVAVVVAYILNGFLIGYLWTRFYLARVLRRLGA